MSDQRYRGFEIHAWQDWLDDEFHQPAWRLPGDRRWTESCILKKSHAAAIRFAKDCVDVQLDGAVRTRWQRFVRWIRRPFRRDAEAPAFGCDGRRRS
jgi:hypothetical protein